MDRNEYVAAIAPRQNAVHSPVAALKQLFLFSLLGYPMRCAVKAWMAQWQQGEIVLGRIVLGLHSVLMIYLFSLCPAPDVFYKITEKVLHKIHEIPCIYLLQLVKIAVCNYTLQKFECVGHVKWESLFHVRLDGYGFATVFTGWSQWSLSPQLAFQSFYENNTKAGVKPHLFPVPPWRQLCYNWKCSKSLCRQELLHRCFNLITWLLGNWEGKMPVADTA